MASLRYRRLPANNDLAEWFLQIFNNWPSWTFMNQNDPMDEWERTLNYPRMEAGLARSHFWSNHHWCLVPQLPTRYDKWLLFAIWEDLFHLNWWLGYNLAFVMPRMTAAHLILPGFPTETQTLGLHGVPAELIWPYSHLPGRLHTLGGSGELTAQQLGPTLSP